MKLALFVIALLPLEASPIISTQLTSFTSTVFTNVESTNPAFSQNCSKMTFSASVPSSLSCTSGFIDRPGPILYASSDVSSDGSASLGATVGGIPDFGGSADARASAEWGYAVTITGGTGSGTAIFCPSESAPSTGISVTNALAAVFGINPDYSANDPGCNAATRYLGGLGEEAYNFTYGMSFPLVITLSADVSTEGRFEPDSGSVSDDPAWTIYTLPNNAQSVPEPTSLALVALGGLALLAINYLRTSSISGRGNR